MCLEEEKEEEEEKEKEKEEEEEEKEQEHTLSIETLARIITSTQGEGREGQGFFSPSIISPTPVNKSTVRGKKIAKTTHLRLP